MRIHPARLIVRMPGPNKATRALIATITVTMSASVTMSACAGDGSGTNPLDAPILALEQELRIDALEHDLVPIAWLGVSPSGGVVVTQEQEFNVRVFDASGEPVATIGRRGQGPGEFMRPNLGGWIGDTLWISDPSLGRVTLIGPSHEVLGTFAQPRVIGPPPEGAGTTPTYFGLGMGSMTSRDTLLMLTLAVLDGPATDTTDGTPMFRVVTGPDAWAAPEPTPTPPRPGSPAEIEDPRRRAVIVNEFARLPSPRGTRVSLEVDGRRPATVPIPFASAPASAFAPNGRLYAQVATDMSNPDSLAFRVHVVDAAGGEVVDRAFPFAPDPIPASAMDSAISAAVERIRPEFRGDMESTLREAVPSHYSLAERILIGNDARIWVGLRATPDGLPWLILSESGDPVGRIILPLNATLRAADEAHVWTTERDEFRLEHVVRYRIGARAR